MLPWRPWSTRERLDSDSSRHDLSEVTAVIPARNEEGFIERTIRALVSQGPGIRIVVVDDCSDDDTLSKAKEAVGGSGLVVRGSPPPPGWSGKLWALEQGLSRAGTEFVLLMDADILLRPSIVSTALGFLKENSIDLLSLMACLRMEGMYERLFMPAFVYFFKLLYPFALSNRPDPLVAAAAGGFILARREALKRARAFISLKDALIDDCTLARRVKEAGGRTWIGLSRSVLSMREYRDMGAIWTTVERAAFTQLRHSTFLLLLTTLLLGTAFMVPVAGLLWMDGKIVLPCLASLSIMCITYLPVLNFYSLSAAQALSLPVVGVLYGAMTWTSAVNYWKGRGTSWKGRRYR